MIDYSHPLFDEFFHYPKVNSTSNQALKLINEKYVHGHFLVIADTQTNGRGRKGASWYSPQGGIWMTAGFQGLPEQSNLTIMIGNSIHQALLKVLPGISDDLTLKWPNDIMLGGLKIAGILTENYPALNYTLVGIGIDSNVHDIPDPLISISTSLARYLGKDIDHGALLDGIFDMISLNLPSFIENGVHDDIMYHNRYSFLTDKKIEITTDFGSYAGICRGLNREGAIKLEMNSGMKQPFFTGSVHVLSEE